MEKRILKVVLDTNILISAIGFGGKPRAILQQVLDNKIAAVSSPILLAELSDVINKKFPRLAPLLDEVNDLLKIKLKIVHPRTHLSIVADEDDNRVVEAALEGECDFIITGDKGLLNLKVYKKTKIVSPNEFLKILALS